MTRGIRVPDPIFAEVRRHFDERERSNSPRRSAVQPRVALLVAMQID